MVMKTRGFTLVEMIMVIVIMGILSAGTFVSLKHLYQRVAKSKALSELSFDSQIIVDQIAALLYDRVPSRVWGYEVNAVNPAQIYEITGSDFKILEWYGTATEAMKAKYYSGFVDMDASDRDTNTTVSYDINKTALIGMMTKKFVSAGKYALIFAGSFDFGDANNTSNYVVKTINDHNITLENRPKEIYEKYYLVDSAYAIARGDDINCSDTNQSNTLYLFYDYRPWQNKTICDGNHTILTKEAKAFEIGIINDSLYFNLTLSRKIGIDTNVTISKQKVVF
ncbi:MAG TPA: type II secretion system protein [Sulfurimonas sp.]|nr:type II secretion system protein [Sulfurimonas sp.]